MAEDTRADVEKLTLAELCAAIAEGRVSYTLHDGCYRVTRRDVSRLRLDLDDPMLQRSLRPESYGALSHSADAH